jgi:tetratricopeptide (TPR) repeat protein
VADDKKNWDDEKTVIDIRSPAAPAADDDRTVVQAPPPAEPPAEEVEKTRQWSPPSAATPGADDDRTIVGSAPRPAAPPEDRTIIGGAASAGPSVASGFELICLSGDGKGRRFPVPTGGALIGSGPGCAITLRGTAEQHARVVAQADGVEIQTLGGAITFHGRAVSRARLKSGDLVRIGDLVVRVVKAGEVFSSTYTEAELAGGGALDIASLARNPKILAIGALLAVVVGLLFWPSSGSVPQAKKQAAGPTAEERKKKDVDALLASGEVLFNAGRLVAPPDQPEAENAYRAFNRVIEIDPGNERARGWLERIDAELQRQASARQQAEAARKAREREAAEARRQELAEKVQAILAEGDAYFERGQIAEPVGANALVKYREALKVDPESADARDRERRAIYSYVGKGDEFREKDDLWRALENYRIALRAAGKDPDIEARVQDTEARLRSLMSGTSTDIVMYKDDRGQLFVLDDKDKVPAKYKDRMVEVKAAQQGVRGR